MSKNDLNVKGSKAAILAHVISSIAFIVVGVCLLMLDATMISTIVYSFSVLAIGILLICFGAYYMIKFFFNKEYMHVRNYGFTMGVILVILGSVFIFRADDISVFIDAIISLIAVVFGAIMLQQSFSLFHLKRGFWFIGLILGVATIGASIFTLVTPFKFFAGEMIPTVFLIAAGSVSLLSLLLMFIGVHTHKKEKKRAIDRTMEENPSTEAADAIFEEEPVFEETTTEKTEESSSTDMFEE